MVSELERREGMVAAQHHRIGHQRQGAGINIAEACIDKAGKAGIEAGYSASGAMSCRMPSISIGAALRQRKFPPSVSMAISHCGGPGCRMDRLHATSAPPWRMTMVDVIGA
jgi:hypothetical protein